MAPSNRDQTTALMACLAATPEDFDFFRAVSLLQAAHPMAPRIGCAESPSDEYVRFGQLPSLSFPSRSLEKFVPGNPARLYVNFFGFFGPSGALPLWATQHAMVCQDLVRRREVEPGGVGESDMPDPSALARFLLRMDVPLAAWLRTRLDAPFLTYLEMVNPARFREDEPRQRLVMAINTVLSDPSFETEGVRMGVLGSVDSADATMREPLHAQLALRSRNRQLFRKAINKAANCEVIVVPDPRAGTDSSFVEFLNLIQHRFYALFYRAWAVHQLEPASFHAETPFAQRHPALRILASLA